MSKTISASNYAKNTNSSGKKSWVPNEVKSKFNWGAFLLTWIWGLGNKTYKTLFIFIAFSLTRRIPLVGIVLFLALSLFYGIKGNEWAWQNKSFDSIDNFNKSQKKWAIAGIIVLIFNVTFLLGLSALLINYHTSSDAKIIENKIVALHEATMLSEALKEKCELTSDGLAECFIKRMNGIRDKNVIKNSYDGSIYTFYGDGTCQNKGDCKVTIETNSYGKSEVRNIPLYLNMNGYIHIDNMNE